MLFKNHAGMFWKITVGLSLVLIIGVAIYSLIFRKAGTYSTNHLVPLDSVITPQQRARDSKQEARVRACLEAIFPGHRFENIRPDWLVNADTGRRLELDCYCPELKLAVEVQGVQHIKPVIGWFHKSYSDFEAGQLRDQAKAELCVQHGVHLLTVPFNVSEGKTCDFLQRELGRRGLLPKHITGW